MSVVTALAAAGGAASPSAFGLAMKGGIMMIPIAACSLVVATVVVERFSVIRRASVLPGSELEALRKACDAGEPQTLRRAIDGSASGLSRVLSAGLSRLGRGRETVERYMASAGEEEVYRLRRRLRALTLVAAVAPLMGLTGTILGMIRAFQTVAASGDSLGKAELLAGGIYEAMVTTAAGLLVAIPTIVFAHVFASKVERLTRELDKAAVAFVEAFASEGGGGRGHAAASIGAPEEPAEEVAAVGAGL